MSAMILLARHASHGEVGRALSGRSEIALSGQGRAEADALARRLDAVRLEAIHSSPRRRARETADIVAAARGSEVEVVDALDEIDFGAWAGQSFATLDRDPAWRAWNAHRGSAMTPASATMAESTARAVRHIEAIDTKGSVLCVSHADIIRGVVAHYLGLPLDHLLRFDIDPASLTTLARHDGGARVVALNERPA